MCEHDDGGYPEVILCDTRDCDGASFDIGDDTRGRHYYFCASCGVERCLAYDDPALKDVPAEDSVESQVYIDGGLEALRAYRKEGPTVTTTGPAHDRPEDGRGARGQGASALSETETQREER